MRKIYGWTIANDAERKYDMWEWYRMMLRDGSQTNPHWRQVVSLSNRAIMRA